MLTSPRGGRTVAQVLEELAARDARYAGYKADVGEAPAAAPTQTTPPSPSATGRPGTKLKLLLRGLGIVTEGCGGCVELARRMDAWGVEGCREPANRDVILQQLRTRQATVSWGTKFKAAFHAVVSGFALRLDPADPAPGLLEEALRLAEAETGQGVTE